MIPDSRQRAPFAHQSSSLDLTSPQNLTTLRSAPANSQRNATLALSSPTESANGVSHLRPEKSYAPWGATMTRKDSNDHLLNGGYADNPYNYSVPNGSFSLDTPLLRQRSLSIASSRAPSPGPFALPQFSVPGAATLRFVSLCSLWYASSAVSSNTGKVILNNFKYPVTLTIVQFFFVALCCIICSRKELGWTGRLRSPTRAILRGTLPMAAFQVGGHIFSSLAISRVPVSTVHTIKALSPLFTVMAYALLFGVSYSPATYLSLLPLTLGVMLACSFDVSLSNFFGLVCAFGSTLIFVSQNIFFKKLVPASGGSDIGAAPKLDKINLLYFSSGMAFILMIPVWLWSDAGRLVDLWLHPKVTPGGPSVPFYFFLNGTVHFAQNLLAFAILSSTSPVTYSIASLVKRIAVICLAIIWFKQSVHGVQAVGIALTGVGLWMYNNAKRDVEKGENKMRQVEAVRDSLLPTTKADQRVLEGRANIEPFGYGLGLNDEIEKVSYPEREYADYPPAAAKLSGFHFPQSAPPHQFAPPYPSPPPSTASSPPTDSHNLPGPRQHRLSNENRDPSEHFRLPPSVTNRAPTVAEENGLDARMLSATSNLSSAHSIGVAAGA